MSEWSPPPHGLTEEEGENRGGGERRHMCEMEREREKAKERQIVGKDTAALSNWGEREREGIGEQWVLLWEQLV